MVKKQSIKKKEHRRLITSVLLILVFLGFIIFNVEYQTGILYSVLMVISLVILLNWDKIPKKRPDRKIFSFEKDWKTDFVIGLVIGVVILLAFSIIPGLSVVGPSVPQAGAFPDAFATAGQWLTVVGIAPLTEEIFFRTVFFAILFIVIGWSLFSSAVVSSLVFSLYHISAYAKEIAFDPILAVSGAFISAFLIGMLFVYINLWRKSVSASIGSHMSINGAIVGSQFVIIG